MTNKIINGLACVVASATWIAIMFFDYEPPQQMVAGIAFLAWSLVSGDRAFR